ncbi:MAG TPA: riboflavin biosynthesis protein RibF, partial [Porticoccaceae bacterium]
YAEGIDSIFCLQFNRSLRQLSAADFVQRVLIDGLGVRCLVVGDDFHFGRDREGSSSMLKAVGEAQGFEVIDTATLVRDGRRISSTWVRECLEAGDLTAAQALLGKPFRISGKVMHGQRLGRTLGVPTANVFLHRYRVPLNGVFVVEVLLDAQRLPAVANVGVRPTVGYLVQPILEVHLLDWDGELYGRRITVEFIERLRCERQFAGVDELLQQINRDIEQARHYFAER